MFTLSSFITNEIFKAKILKEAGKKTPKRQAYDRNLSLYSKLKIIIIM